MATHSKGIHGLPQCYGTRDTECANRGCMWERGCAAETWTDPREWTADGRRVRNRDFELKDHEPDK